MEDARAVRRTKRLQNLLGLTLAEIKDMVEGEEVRSEMRATYRPDLQPEERLRRVTHLRAVTERQRAIIDEPWRARTLEPAPSAEAAPQGASAAEVVGAAK